MTAPEPDASFERLLESIKHGCGFDLTGYKRSTLLRRTRKRMEEVGIEGFSRYEAFLEARPDEFARLLDTVLINVTDFFRDPEAWASLAREFASRVAAKGGDEPIRVWSPGCASGEETYTLVMVLAEVLGMERFRERVTLYATDVDEEALDRARRGSYAPEALEAVPAGLRERYFRQRADGCAFRRDLLHSVTFGRHDLVQDAPISHLDLLVCRNLLMYFDAGVQARIVGRFHFALGDRGLLFLGMAETVWPQGSLFAPVDLPSRIFARLPRSYPSEPLAPVAYVGAPLPAERCR